MYVPLPQNLWGRYQRLLPEPRSRRVEDSLGDYSNEGMSIPGKEHKIKA